MRLRVGWGALFKREIIGSSPLHTFVMATVRVCAAQSATGLCSSESLLNLFNMNPLDRVKVELT